MSAYANTSAVDVCAVDVHYEDPLCGEPREGPEDLADHAARLWTMFPDVRVERTGERLSDGHFVAAPCKVLGTHRGDLDGLPASGRFVVVHLVSYLELDRDGERVLRALLDHRYRRYRVDGQARGEPEERLAAVRVRSLAPAQDEIERPDPAHGGGERAA